MKAEKLFDRFVQNNLQFSLPGFAKNFYRLKQLRIAIRFYPNHPEILLQQLKY